MIKKIIISFAFTLSVSLSICVAADALVPNQGHDIEESILSPRERIQKLKKLMDCPEYSSKRFSNDWWDILKEDFKIFKKKIAEFFPGEPLRLDDFNKIYNHGEKLFENNATPSSKEVMVTYLGDADLLSQRPLQFQNKKLVVNWRNPSSVLDILHSEEHKHTSYGSTFQHDYFFLPIVSKDGLISLEDLNFCIAHKIVCVGIPYAKQFNDFDLEKNTSVLEFALHDVEHGNFYKYGPERLDIFNKMQSNPNKIFEAVFFWVYHEEGYAGNDGPMSMNPIQNVLKNIDDSVGLYNSQSKKKSPKELLRDKKSITLILNVFKHYDHTLNVPQDPVDLDMQFAKNYLYEKFIEFEKEYYDFLPH